MPEVAVIRLTQLTPVPEKAEPARTGSVAPAAPAAEPDQSFRWPAKGRVISGYGTSGNGTPAAGYSTASADYGSTAGYGTGSLGGSGVADAGMPSATCPTTSTTSALPVTPGAAPGAVEAGMATVPSGDLPDAHRSTQPMAPDGTPMPIGSDGHLTAEGDDAVTRGER